MSTMTEQSDLFQTVFYGSWWHSLELREVRLKILESVKIKINDVDVFTAQIIRRLVMISKYQLMLTNA